MLEVKNLTLRRGTKELLSNTSVRLAPGGKIGFIGANGAGKSSFFSALTGEILPDAGEILLPRQSRIAMIRQETPVLAISARDFVLNSDTRRLQLLAALTKSEEENKPEESGEIYAELAAIDAFSAPARASKLLSSLGFDEEQQDLPVASFSGGWRMRLNLAQALFQPADLLLLDEPTNHLDLETVLWLAHYLPGRDSTQIIISHDIDFLNRVTSTTLGLEGGKLILYAGNYDFYAEERARRVKTHNQAYAKQQREIEHLESYIARFRYKASKAKGAQSRVKALEKMERIIPLDAASPFSFQFFPLKKLPHTLLKAAHLTVGYDAQHPLVADINYSWESTARVGLLGVNGSGKSTLIKTLIGEIPPLDGEIIRAEKLTIGYFAQHQIDALNGDATLLDALREKAPETPDAELRTYLGRFNFSGEVIYEPIHLLSGGEKSRLALALLIWQKPNFLLLDEPTNHLDIEMRTALTCALQNFTGAMMLVSHDRHLLDATCAEFIYIKDGVLQRLEGNLADYERMLATPEEKEKSRDKINARAGNPAQDKKEEQAKKIAAARKRQAIAQMTKPLRQKRERLETLITRLEEEKKHLAAKLADPELYHDAKKKELKEMLARDSEIKRQLNVTEEEWLSLEEEIGILSAEVRDTA